MLTDVRKEVDKVQTVQNQVIEAQNQQIAGTQKTQQYVSDRVHSARFANNENTAKNPYTDTVEKQLVPAASVLPEPSEKSKAEIVQVLQMALNDSEANREKLALTYSALQAEAEKLKTENAALATDLSKKNQELQTATTSLQTKMAEVTSKEQDLKIAAAQAADAQAKAQSEAASKKRLFVAGIFMILGGMVVVGGIVAAYFKVPGVVWPALAGGAALLVIGWLITLAEDLLQHTWFKITVAVVCLAVGGILAWLGYRSSKRRQEAKFDAAISNDTIAALQELKNDDEKRNTNNFALIRPYLEEWHTTSDGYANHEIHKEIDRRLIEMNLKLPKARTSPQTSATDGGSLPTAAKR